MEKLASWWVIEVLDSVASFWAPVLITVLLSFFFVAIFEKIIFPNFYEFFKRWFGLKDAAKEMKSVLEDSYEDLWQESEFCVAFLALHDEMQRLLAVATSDVNGKPCKGRNKNSFRRI
ncbi:unnamed protein product [Caenorhabditis auriculariae]|uniref:Uncharacterized protein n=1 Tax=Caenorhabditis auriculariae TaxID=2777116 RepID=A0A8S1GMD6_9PELO|nr:unnamed protein product [Caenorhabditis auriculariae]